MSIRKNRNLSIEQQKEVMQRFQIAQDDYHEEGQSEDRKEQLEIQEELRNQIFHVGLYITRRITNGRERFKALEKLEEALMWGGKAIFKKDGE